MASNPPPDLPKGKYGALIAIVGTAAAAIMVPMVGSFEGKRNDPYADMVGRMTVCFGETRVEMRRYSDQECNEMLAGGLAHFASQVLSCTPGLKDKPNALAAATSLSYNIGTAAYCRSTVARRFNAGRIADGCDGFLAWRYAGGREIPGLLKRRKAEAAVCRRDAA